MGIAVWDLIPRKTIEPEELSGQVIALDAFNVLYYFLAVIRHRTSGELLKDHAGRITSHLSGLLYRTVSFLEASIKPVYVFNGHYPHFKRRTVRQRRARREAATRKWKEAVRKGLPAFKYAQEAARINADIVETSKELLDLWGCPGFKRLQRARRSVRGCVNEVWSTRRLHRISTLSCLGHRG
jgi:flap endonuclease-1